MKELIERMNKIRALDSDLAEDSASEDSEIEEKKGLDKATLKVLKSMDPSEVEDLDDEIGDALALLSNASGRLGSKLAGTKEIKIARDALREVHIWTSAQVEMNKYA